MPAHRCEVALILGPGAEAPEGAFFTTERAYFQRSAVVRELDGEVVILGLDQGLDGLQIVPALAADPKLVPLDLRLDALGALVPNQLGHLLGVLGADAFLGRRHDLVQLAGRARLAGVERLQADPTLDQLGLEDVEHRFHSFLGVGLHIDLLAGPVNARVGVLEVKALTHLLGRLIHGVVYLLPVDLADHIERIFRCHDCLRSDDFCSVILPKRHLLAGGGLLYDRLVQVGRVAIVSPRQWSEISWLGRLPEWPKGAVCKTVGIAYVGSNPTPATSQKPASD